MTPATKTIDSVVVKIRARTEMESMLESAAGVRREIPQDHSVFEFLTRKGSRLTTLSVVPFK